MKGITGHRVLDAYTTMGVSPVGPGRKNPDSKGAQNVAPDAFQLRISADARRLASEATDQSARLSELKEKAQQGSSAFDAGLVASRLVGDLTGTQGAGE